MGKYLASPPPTQLFSLPRVFFPPHFCGERKFRTKLVGLHPVPDVINSKSVEKRPSTNRWRKLSFIRRKMLSKTWISFYSSPRLLKKVATWKAAGRREINPRKKRKFGSAGKQSGGDTPSPIEIRVTSTGLIPRNDGKVGKVWIISRRRRRRRRLSNFTLVEQGNHPLRIIIEPWFIIPFERLRSGISFRCFITQPV